MNRKDTRFGDTMLRILMIDWLKYLRFIKNTNDPMWESEKEKPTFVGFMDWIDAIIRT